MSGFETAHLIYLVVLLCGVAGIFFGSQKQDLGQMAKYTLIWGGIFMVLLVVIQLFMGFSAS